MRAVSPRWYVQLMELFEVSVDRQAVIDMLPALLMAAGLGAGSLPVRIEDSAVLVPARLYDLFVRVIEAHGLDEEVQEAVDADYRRQKTSCGLSRPTLVSTRARSAIRHRTA